jgi:hypothetical protein
MRPDISYVTYRRCIEKCSAKPLYTVLLCCLYMQRGAREACVRLCCFFTRYDSYSLKKPRKSRQTKVKNPANLAPKWRSMPCREPLELRRCGKAASTYVAPFLLCISIVSVRLDRCYMLYGWSHRVHGKRLKCRTQTRKTP